MYSDECAKIQAEQLYTGGLRGAATPLGYAQEADQQVQSGRELLIHRLQRQQYDTEQQSKRRARVLEILQRHPEFEEFLEVLHSGLL